MDELIIQSTSRVTAEASDIPLRETQTTRLIFRPILVANQNDPAAGVKGHFLYQRKSPTGNWEDFETIPLSSFRAGEGYKLEIKSAELLRLHREITNLYEIHGESGVPRGKSKYVKATPQLELLAGLSSEDINSFLSANRSVGSALLIKLLTWAIEVEDPVPLFERLVELGPSALKKLNAVAGLQGLKIAVDVWKNNSSSEDEEFWQKSLAENSFVLERVFAWPTSVVAGKAYVGGKSVTNKGGNIVDFLLKNELTRNAALIEIKTPSTPLLGSEYRSGVYNVSVELTGSVQQVLNYKHSLQEQYLAITKGQEDLFQSFDPQCVVIIGSTRRLDTSEKVKSFELYRRQMPGVLIVTYDELYEKTRKLIEIMETPEVEDLYDDDIPF